MDKIDSKDLYCYNKFWINAILFNFLLIKEKSKTGSKNIKQHNSFTIVNQHIRSATLIIIQHIRSATLILIQHFRMISEGSCDTEDWSNDAENSALLHMNKLYFKV